MIVLVAVVVGIIMLFAGLLVGEEMGYDLGWHDGTRGRPHRDADDLV